MKPALMSRRRTISEAKDRTPAEQKQGPEVQSSTPKSTPFPVVGVGASAGGLEAFTRLLQHLAGDTGMAFVFVQHLAPRHASMLASLLSRATTMPVMEAQHDTRVNPIMFM